jgi:L-2,4-diaminobutyrate decarboxylase
MDDVIHQAYDPELFRTQGHQLVDMLADYLKKCLHSDHDLPVLPYIPPDELLSSWEKDFSQAHGQDLKKFYSLIIDQSIHTHHPQCMGHQVSPVIPLAALSDLLGSFLDCGVGVYEMGSAAVVLERVIIKKMASLFGMGDRADGILTSGGSLGNLTALLASRQCKDSEYKMGHKGQGSDLQPAVMMSDEVHYSIKKAINVMGWGEDAIISVPVDEHFRLKAGCLEESYRTAGESGKTVLAVVGNACSTSTGSYDPLHEIADFCDDHNLWFHVDGAHGGAAIFSDKYRYLVKGIERADSVIIDFHKMMMMPALATAVIFKEEDSSYRTFSSRASYLWEKADEREWYNLGRRTFECTKDMMSIKIYSIFRAFGTQLFSELITSLYDQGVTFGRIISECPDFELAVTPLNNIVCFRFKPKYVDGHEINKFNTQIRQGLIKDGAYHIVQTTIRDKVFLRSVIMNPFTTEKEMVGLLDKIRAIAARISKKLR